MPRNQSHECSSMQHVHQSLFFAAFAPSLALPFPSTPCSPLSSLFVYPQGTFRELHDGPIARSRRGCCRPPPSPLPSPPGPAPSVHSTRVVSTAGGGGGVCNRAVCTGPDIISRRSVSVRGGEWAWASVCLSVCLCLCVSVCVCTGAGRRHLSSGQRAEPERRRRGGGTGCRVTARGARSPGECDVT